MRRNRWQQLALTLALLLVQTSSYSTAAAQNGCPERSSDAEVDQRIDQMIEAMTIPERIAQLQDRAPAIPRLHLPAYNWWNEGLHGLARDGYATVFPQAIALAATWDPALLHAVGDVVGSEARAKFNGHGGRDTPRYGGLTVWSPNINIFRDPRWGRGQETYGEDPYLTGTLGVAFVTGMQGPDPTHPQADATPKHFAVHSGPESGRDSFNAVVSPHDLADTYTPAFHAVLTEGHASAVMCSYNEINGVPSCAKSATLQQLVRDEWGFSGYIVSDCDAVGNISAYHHYATDAAHGVADALNAGVDLDCGNSYDALNQSLAQGLVSEGSINRALHRLLLARARLGILPNLQCPDKPLKPGEIHSPEHAALALRAAEESSVLLKNDGVLPLKPGDRVAVVGPTADLLKILEANYHGTAVQPVTLLDGVAKAVSNSGYAQGSLLAEGVSLPIPRTALRTGPEPDAKPGLRAEYFQSASMDGQPALRSIVPKVDLDLDRVGPEPAIQNGHYAARWTGTILPVASGDYQLRVNVERCWDCTTHDRFDLSIDGKVVIHNDGTKGSKDTAFLHFADTSPHAVKLDYLHTGEDEGVALEWIPPANALLDEAVRASASADVIIACVGLSPDLEGEALQVTLPGFAGGDRTSLNLPEAQRLLLQRLQSLHKKIIIVLTSGSAVSLGAFSESASAILEAWYPGEAGGTAIANLLSGVRNPSGRLPVTFYRSVEDLPAFSDYNMDHRTYRYFQKPVEFAFGFGLSYSQFTYSDVHLSSSSVQAGSPVTVSVKVRNSGKRAGGEVSQLYIVPPQVPGAPRLALRGVSRNMLQPGEGKDVKFKLSPETLSTVDLQGERLVRAGVYRIYVGGAQPDLAQAPYASLEITGEAKLAPAIKSDMTSSGMR